MFHAEKYLRTSQYLLRLLDSSDQMFYLEVYRNPMLMKQIGEVSDSKVLLSGFKKSQRLNSKAPMTRLSYCILKDQKRIGLSSLIRSKSNPKHCEIGTIVVHSFMNKGVATEIMQTLMKEAFDQHQIKRVFANFSTKNIAALNLVNKLGFTVCSESNGFHYCFIEAQDNTTNYKKEED